MSLMSLRTFKVLASSENCKSADCRGIFYCGSRMLEKPIDCYDYYDSLQLNQWLFEREKDEGDTFFRHIFRRNDKGKLVVLPLLINTIENSMQGYSSFYYNVFGLLVCQMLQDEAGNNPDKFNLDEEARIFCCYARSEYVMRNKYERFLDTGDWGRTSQTYIIMTNCDGVYEQARKHRFCGICKPPVMEEEEQEGMELPPEDDDEMKQREKIKVEQDMDGWCEWVVGVWKIYCFAWESSIEISYMSFLI